MIIIILINLFIVIDLKEKKILILNKKYLKK